MTEFRSRYEIRRNFPDLANFRLGPSPFDQTALDWIAFFSSGRPEASELIAHGICTRINWNGEASELPRGWMGAVRQSYEESIIAQQVPNTLIGLFIYAEKAFREHGWAATVAEMMKNVASGAKLLRLIIPLRLPTRYELGNVEAPYEEFAFRKREDGEYLDHWLRMHVRMGAEVIGFSKTSHQHAMHPTDLLEQFECGPLKNSGTYVVRRGEEYYSAYVDLEHECAVINEGCVWVLHRSTEGARE